MPLSSRESWLSAAKCGRKSQNKLFLKTPHCIMHRLICHRQTLRSKMNSKWITRQKSHMKRTLLSYDANLWKLHCITQRKISVNLKPNLTLFRSKIGAQLVAFHENPVYENLVTLSLSLSSRSYHGRNNYKQQIKKYQCQTYQLLHVFIEKKYKNLFQNYGKC